MIPTPLPPPAAKSQRLRVGGPVKVLLVMDNAQLLLHMTEAVRQTEGAQLAAAFTTATEAIDWVVWDRQGWHVAFVDLGLQHGSAEEVVRMLLAQPRAGTVVAVVDHLWREVREACARMGVRDLVEKGDLIAFNGVLETWTR